jgi:hypothetical protein
MKPHITAIPGHNVIREKRVLNEFKTKTTNEEKLDKVIEARPTGEQTLHDVMPFDCECDDTTCNKTIEMSTEEYKRVHDQSGNFVVMPSHVQLDIEAEVAAFSNYVIVAKYPPGPGSS